MGMVQIANICASAESDPEWNWALKNLDDIQLAKSNINLAMTTFGRQFMCLEVRELRKAYTDSDFILRAETFRQSMEPKLASAQTDAKRLVAMHKSRTV